MVFLLTNWEQSRMSQLINEQSKSLILSTEHLVRNCLLHKTKGRKKNMNIQKEENNYSYCRYDYLYRKFKVLQKEEGKNLPRTNK